MKKFLEEGATVVLTASRKETAEKAVTRVKESCPDAKVEGIWPDLSSLESVKESFAKIHEKYGRIDILVNNAGMSDSAPFTNYTEDLFEKVMDLNVKGVFHASRAVVDYMVEQGSGVILSTSSMVSISGQAAGVAYPTSKFCGKWIYDLSRKGTWAEGNPCQCGGAWYHGNGYDEGCTKGSY